MPQGRFSATDIDPPAGAAAPPMGRFSAEDIDSPPASARELSLLEIPGQPRRAPEPVAPTPEPEARTMRSRIGDRIVDVLTSGAEGVLGTGQAAIGLGDLATGGRAGDVARGLGIDLEGMRAKNRAFYSPEQQEANRAVSDADGVGGTLRAVAENPSVIPHAVVQAVAPMLGGAGAARLIGAVPWLAKAAPFIGEGLVQAGSAAEQTERETGGLTLGQGALAATSGAGTAALGALGGKVAQKLGIADIDVLLAGGASTPKARHFATNVVLSAVQEGLLEELPQSIQEQVLQNLATNRPLSDGVDSAAVLGAITGAAMGGGAQVMAHQPRPSAIPVTPRQVEPPAGEMPAPAVEPSAGTPPVDAAPVDAQVNPAGAEAPPYGRFRPEDIETLRPQLPITLRVDDDTQAPPPIVDRLDTGEGQPRLPGDVGAVRERDVATPTIDAPFSLAREVGEQPTGTQTGMFGPQDIEPEAPAAAAPAKPAIPVTPRRKGQLNEPATKVTYDETTPDERQELRRILAEMEAMPYESRTMNPIASGAGQGYDVVAGFGGAPVFHDIATTDRHGRPQGTRREIVSSLKFFLEDGKRSAASDRAMDVARRRIAKDPSLTRPSLPPEAGELPGKLRMSATEGLEPDQQAVETRFRQGVERNARGFMQRYRERFGNVIGSDLVKEMADDYAATPDSRSRHARAIHGTTQQVARALYRERLREGTEEGKQSLVLMTAGGTGSGKTSSLSLMPEARDGAHVVYDSTLSNYDTARADIDAALETGHQVGIVFTVRDPEAAFREGVLPRAAAEGRVVSVDSHARTHTAAPQVFARLREHYASNDRVEFAAVENRGLSDRQFIDPATVGQVAYNEANVRESAERILDEERAAGRVPERVYANTTARRKGLAEEARRAESQPADRPAQAPDRVARKPKKSSGGTPSSAVLPVSTGLTRDLPERPRGKAPIPVTARHRPSDIVEQMRRLINDIPVSVGHFGERAYGIYKIKPRAIRLKVANNLQTFFHESGHHIDENVLGITRADPRWEAELLTLGEATSRKSYSKTQKLQEGAAEFLRWWFTEPSVAKSKAPNYTAEFERRLDERPEWRDDLLEVRENLQGLISQNPATRGRLRINRDKPPRFPVLAAAVDDPREAIRAIATRTVDDLLPLRQAVEAMSAGRPVETRMNAYALARISRGAAGKAEAFLERGVRGRDGKFISPALRDILRPVKDAVEPLGDYLVARRALELHGRGIEPGMPVSEAKGIIAETEARPDIDALDTAADQIYEFQDAVLEYARLYGSMSREQIAVIKHVNESYVPMQRAFDAADGSVRGIAKRIANRELPIKRIRGSGRDVIDPFESIITNTFAMVDMVEKNRAMQALVRQAEDSDDSARWLEKIPTPKVATRFKLDQVGGAIARALNDAGVGQLDPKILKKGFDEATKGVTEPSVIDVAGNAAKAGIKAVAPVPSTLSEFLDEMVTVWTPTTFAKDSEQIVTVLRNGEREFWQVHDDALYQAISVMGPRTTSEVAKFLKIPTRWLRAGATLTPGFVLRNPVRDTTVAYLQSRHGFIPVYDSLRGFIAQVRGDEDAKLFFASGVAQAAMGAQHRGDRQEAVRRITKGGGLKDVVFHPLDLMRAFSEWSEVSTRLGEFKLALDAGGAERGVWQRLMSASTPRPQVREEALTRATLAARDVTTDFSRGGTHTRELNEWYAFFNARVQGYARAYETIERDPIGTALKAASIAAFTAALWALNADDDEYNEKQEWEKHTYWFLRRGGKGFIRIPKPFEYGYVADLTEAALDYARRGNPGRFKTIRASFLPGNLQQTVVSHLPTTILPLLEASINYSSFKDTHIVSPWDLDLESDLQYSEWTSETAKQLGKVIPVAPALLDHLIYGYTAGVGRGVVGGADLALGQLGIVPRKNLPDKPVQQLPIVGNFMSDHSFGGDAQSIQDIYDLAERFGTVDESVKTDVKRGDQASAERRLARAKTDLPWTQRDAVLDARKALKNLGPTIKAIYAAPPAEMTPAQKRVRLDAVREDMVDISRRALGRTPLRRKAP